MYKRILCGAALLLAANLSHADIITQNFDIDTQSTDISETVSFNLFNTVNGTRILESVTFSLNGIVNGTTQVENLNANETNVSARLSASVVISDAINGDLVVLTPSVSDMASLGGFDGSVDYTGESGTSFVDLNANQFDEVTFTDSASLAAYTGAGTSSLDFLVNAMSSVSGGGNLVAKFATVAGANIQVIYSFRDKLAPSEVNEPALFAILGFGLLALVRIKRK